MWLVRSLVCRALEEPAGRVVLVTGCDTGIGHEVGRVVCTNYVKGPEILTGTGTKAGTKNITGLEPGPRAGTRFGPKPGLRPGPGPGP